MARPPKATFKHCTLCQARWETPLAMTEDPSLKALGMVVDFEDPYRTLFLFNHTCGTTLSLTADDLLPLLPSLSGEMLAGLEGCPRHCFKFDNLEPCGESCNNAPLRQLLSNLSKREPTGDP
jgi:hypothetical protein